MAKFNALAYLAKHATMRTTVIVDGAAAGRKGDIRITLDGIPAKGTATGLAKLAETSETLRVSLPKDDIKGQGYVKGARYSGKFDSGSQAAGFIREASETSGADVADEAPAAPPAEHNRLNGHAAAPAK